MSTVTQLAEQSCISCRRLKRKCTKQLPRCALCTRVGRMCEYQSPPVTPLRSHASSDATVSRPFDPSLSEEQSSRPFASVSSTLFRPTIATTQQKQHAARSALAASFLDSVASRGADVNLPTDMEWSDVVAELPALSVDAAWLTCERYFNNTHEYLPIVAKMRLSRTLSSGIAITAADLQALLQAMRLSCEPSSELRNQIYRSVKLALIMLEQYGQFSTNFLAAYTLVALHEVGHGLFPVAYLTVGSIARIFIAVGLHDRKKATQFLRRPDTWTETEERRRIWWAVIILDRYVHVGFRFRPLSISSIPADEIIPGSDTDWDVGELSVNPLLVMSMEASSGVSPFARTCHAAHLLGRVCNHVNEHSTSSDVEFHFQEASSISRALQALIAMLHNESRQAGSQRAHLYFGARGLAYAALNTLYDVHACIEQDEIESIGGNRGLRLDLQQLAIDGYKQVTNYTAAFGAEIEQYAAAGELDKVPPFACFSLHTAAGTYAWYARENGAEEHLRTLDDLRRVLEMLSKKWEVAAEYHKLLDGQEYVYEVQS